MELTLKHHISEDLIQGLGNHRLVVHEDLGELLDEAAAIVQLDMGPAPRREVRKLVEGTRHAEAELLRGRAAQLQADFPEALALSGSNGGALEEQAGEAWFGLEPWYAADCDFDWLAAARPVCREW